MTERLWTKILLLLCSHSPNDVPPPEPQRNVSVAAVRGVVRPSKTKILLFSTLFNIKSVWLCFYLVNLWSSRTGDLFSANTRMTRLENCVSFSKVLGAEQCRSRSDCSERSLISICTVCLPFHLHLFYAFLYYHIYSAIRWGLLSLE